MNFDHMPELHWLLGYPIALLLMVVTSVSLYGVFKRRRWLEPDCSTRAARGAGARNPWWSALFVDSRRGSRGSDVAEHPVEPTGSGSSTPYSRRRPCDELFVGERHHARI